MLPHLSYMYSTEILCPELPVLGNGTITIVPGNTSTTLGLGFTATYSCNTGFVVVEQTTRVCQDTNGGTVTTGTWSGSEPTCQGGSINIYT